MTKKDFNTAFKLYNSAYEYYGDKIDASVLMMKIGFLYIHGIGVDKDKDKGLEWLIRAIKTGNKSVIKTIEEEFNIKINYNSL